MPDGGSRNNAHRVSTRSIQRIPAHSSGMNAMSCKGSLANYATSIWSENVILRVHCMISDLLGVWLVRTKSSGCRLRMVTCQGPFILSKPSFSPRPGTRAPVF